ncbi:MAG: DUF4249 domain-containing protein [Gemmatimonadetes bacterium]|nr:DUF4249 domain-containing protein [Gemmatimonadota bacterium]
MPLVLAGAYALADVSLPAGEEVVAVEAVLRTDAFVQSVVLHRSLDGRDVRGVPGARVTVTAPGGRAIAFHESDEGCFRVPAAYFFEEPGSVEASCYLSSVDEGTWVRPGAVYLLRVETPDGRVIQGRTRVPGAFGLVGLPFTTRAELRGAATCALPPGRILPVAWTRSDSAWSYVAPVRIFDLRAALMRAGIQAEIPDPLELVGLAISEEDTTIALPSEFGAFDRFRYDNAALTALQSGFPDGVVAELVVAAADRNYVNGVRGGRFNPSGPVRISSVSGDGVGVFGSLVPLYLLIRVQPDDVSTRTGLARCSG